MGIATLVHAEAKNKLLLVKISHWKTRFFGLPDELPVLMSQESKSPAGNQQYNFSEGMEAMRIYMLVNPEDKYNAAYERFIQTWPKFQAFFNAIQNENFKAAETYLREVLAIAPEMPAAHFYLGSLNSQRQAFAEAEKNYRNCLAFFPAYGPAYINLAKLLRARQAIAEARAVLNEAVGALEKTDQQQALSIARQMLKTL
jgi:tetratricopeptide (TPR) repeat protein